MDQLSPFSEILEHCSFDPLIYFHFINTVSFSKHENFLSQVHKVRISGNALNAEIGPVLVLNFVDLCDFADL